MKKLILFLIILVGQTFAQTGQFDITRYGEYLNNHKDMSPENLLGLYPAGVFKSNIKENYNFADYSDSIKLKYNLTKAEISLIEKNGFVISDRLSYSTYGQAFLDIYQKDMPLFLSCDAVLHAFHKSYDKLLMDLEIESIIPKLNDVLGKLAAGINTMNSKYASIPDMKESLQDLDLYIAIGNGLMGNTVNLFYSENKTKYNEIMNDITAETPAYISLFCNTARKMDFSQFKVRGHYTNTYYPILQKYFKAMIWYGRTEIYLIAPETLDVRYTDADIRRQIIDAILINELVKSTGTMVSIENIEKILKLFIGESDNVTIWNLQDVIASCNILSADEILQTGKMETFQNTLKTKSYAFQRILSQILYGSPMSPNSIKPASSFLLFGQRFIIDSYVTAQVVFDKINYQNTAITRMLPSTLDILFSLGNNAALQLLKPELDQYKYSSNLDALRYLIDSYEGDFWDASIYNSWLNAIRALNPQNDRNKLPMFMQTAAYWQQKMNTQLTSWTELRHDNLLYAKQSYTGSAICSFPYIYIEPIPAFYNNMKTLAKKSKEIITNLEIETSWRKTILLNYFTNLYNTCDTLEIIADKELNNTPITETYFLARALSEEHGCTPIYSGWLPKLYYNDGSGIDGFTSMDYITVDFHTAPTDEFGGDIGWVKHSGTGEINMGIYVIGANGEKRTYIGPAGSYYEYTTTNFKRLTDEDWKHEYLWKSLRPSFVNSYMTDTLGNAMPSGASLLTGINSYNEKNNTKFELSQNFPNPFNPSTNIIYTIPSDYAKASVSLVVYDINGREVKTLLKGNLSPGNYITKWDGRNERGIPATSGVYFYTLKIDKYSETKRMMLVK
jgi:hypothetical protein